MHAKRARRYLVQWTPSWLSVRYFHYAQKNWKTIETSQDEHAGKGGALSHHEIRVHWAPSWVSSRAPCSTRGLGCKPGVSLIETVVRAVVLMSCARKNSTMLKPTT
ncbi:hypothetical protein BDR22DRAFT_867045 [Usnea florida]